MEKIETSKEVVPLYLVDAFTEEPFKGNPAAVCILKSSYSTNVLQTIAAEMNLSETAFLHSPEKKSLKESKIFSLRWFTPKVEMPLCGHATLASAAVLFFDVVVSTNEIVFETVSGRLTAKKEKESVILNFPAGDLSPISPPPELLNALGVADYKDARYCRKTGNFLVILPDEKTLRGLEPNFEHVKAAHAKEKIRGVIITSPGTPPYDFVSRYFAPWIGINEDPVTGSAHTTLALYWSKKLGKREMLAFQASPRGGTLTVRLHPNNDRVDLIGKAVIVSKGELYIPSKLLR
ncbi:MAG: PhzF family phenazine biosynthesis protein [Candidatus Bathycorpusculaceae bacterium]